MAESRERRFGRPVVGGLVALIGALASVLVFGSASASAATWFASPDGDGPSPCAFADPCEIEFATSSAPAGSTIDLAAGTYVAGAVVTVDAGRLLKGPYSGSPAILTGNSSGEILRASGAGTIVRDVAVVQSGSGEGLAVADGATARRIDAEATVAGPACGVDLGGTLGDSLCVNTGGGSGVLVDETSAVTGEAELVNVTAIGSADDVTAAALFVRASGGADVAVEATNVIAQALGDGPDITVGELIGGSQAKVELASSNYDLVAPVGDVELTPPGTAGNQTAAPLFADATAGDFSEAAGSPTIDAGTSPPSLGFLDLVRRARIVGSAPDIGAFEFDPPPDTRPPSVSIPVAPKGRIKTRKRFVDLTFEFASDDPGVSFECRISGDPSGPCSSPATFTLRATRGEGTLHKLTVRAVDAAGNRSGKATRQVRLIRTRG